MAKRRQKPSYWLNKLMKQHGYELRGELAKLLNCSDATISIIYKTENISRKLRRKIDTLTEGEIGYRDWLL